MRLRKLIIYILTLFVISVGFFKSQSQSDFYISDGQGNQNPVIDCSYPFVNGSCINLTANYPQFKLTNSYSVSSIPYSPYSATNKTVIKENIDDSFSGTIDLPFTFCFYGNAYNKLVIGSNGMISFDVGQANQPNAPNFTATLPSQNLPKESIFGVLHDMYFLKTDNSEINYSVIGSAPFRKFIVNFEAGNVSGCEPQTSTSQIVLSEGSNKIEVFVKNKDLPCNLAKYPNALIGINDASGNLGVSAPGRNTGVWSAQNEAWVFAPSGSNLVPYFTWFDGAGNVIGYSKNQMVCPQKDETFKVNIVYNTCNGQSITYTDDINIKFAKDYPTVQPYTKIVCNIADKITLADYKQFLTTNDISNFNFEFLDAATGLSVDENTPFSISANRNFNVTVSNKNTPNCKRTTTLQFQFFSENILTNQVEVCDMLNDKIERNYLLSNFGTRLVGYNYYGTIRYYLSYDDALNNRNQKTNYDLVDGSQFFVRLDYQTCTNVLGPVTVKFNSTPIVTSPIDIEVKMCDSNDDGIENFNWADLVKNKVTTDAGVSLIRVFSSYDNAFNASPYSSGLTTIRDGQYKVYARVEYPGGCFSIAEINMNVIFGVIKLNDSNTYICFDGTQDIPVNLDTLTTGMLLDPLDGTVKGPFYFGNYQDAMTNDPNKIIPANQIITDDGDFVTKTFYARFDKGKDCYSIKAINVYLIHLVKNIDQFSICDDLNDNTEAVQLSNYYRFVNYQYGTQALFFASNAAATANVSGTNITTATINGSLVLYARVSYRDCVLIFPVTFSLTTTPKIKSEVIAVVKNICDNNADGVEELDATLYESQININNENVDFAYYRSYDAQNKIFSNPYYNPTKIPVSNGNVVYVRVRNRLSNCVSAAKITFDLEFYPPIYLAKNAVLKLCDKDLNFGESFDLNLATSQIFDQSINKVLLSDLDITYYVTEADANNGTNVGKITSPYPTSAGNVFVYVRFQSKTYGCYSVAPINLLSYFPAKARNSIIKICDNNVDGFYDVNLMDYTTQMVQIPSSENVFTFYLNQADIGVSGKEIQNPSNFILNPYTSKIWVYVENLKDCGSSAEVNFVNGTQLSLSQNQFNKDVCDTGNDNKETISLTDFETTFSNSSYTYEYFENYQDMTSSQNKIPTPSSYLFDVAKGITKFYVKVSQNGFCPNYFTIDIVLKKTPIIEIQDYYYCKNDEIGLEIRPNFTGLNVVYYKWEYPDGSISEGANKDFISGVKQVGTYKLTLTNSLNCDYTATFKVINIDTPEITALRGQNDYYDVIATGIAGRKILYSMDMTNWQESNRFGNLKPGDYTFYVRYSDSDCRGDMRMGRIFSIINTLTPNGDGINDYWKLSGLDVFPESSTLQIFDKFGNLVYKQISNTEFIWDGKFNGRNVTTDAYWYLINAADGRIYNGWILLKNRN